MSSSSGGATVAKQTPPQPLQWTSLPLRDEGLRGWAPLTAVPLAAIVAGWVTGSGTWAGVWAVLLMVALWRQWLPATYEMGPDGVAVRVMGRVRRIGWRTIRVCEVLPHGVLLSPVTRPALLDMDRGWYVPWGPHRERVLTVIEHYLPAILSPAADASFEVASESVEPPA